MLELRPCCECCEAPLPADASNAMICSFECTFCVECVETHLDNVCPNCGGGFTARPIRPKHDWVNGNCVTHYPASTERVVKPVDPLVQQLLVTRLAGKLPEQR
ncbi:hypothetical protein AHAT_29490 [Agarivorans sp. Toyoura001]|uniref:DUF1272 domain-containing protein n=1 Tax=Agarivorans sp. Toyoura001 TaxID=2283141 RepID=UPI0010E04969|nr:DUF1272 domain-containing protein [Agarivorans sp. Toyoura001]GDY27059.1 hypothetical protein AHAT_29490 [Agarivorans sp. Toyoura001]